MKGVSVDEIKLYGEMESDEALDESFCEDSFGKLEAVISKVNNIVLMSYSLLCHFRIKAIEYITDF